MATSQHPVPSGGGERHTVFNGLPRPLHPPGPLSARVNPQREGQTSQRTPNPQHHTIPIHPPAGGRGREAGRSEYTGRGVGWRAAAAAAVGLCGNGGVGNTSSCGIRDAGEPLAPALPAGAPQLAGAHRDSVADGGGLRRRRPSHLIGRDPQRYHQLSGWAASRLRTSVESLILVLNHVDKTILWSYYDPCQGANNGGVLGDDVHSPPRRSAGPEKLRRPRR